MNLWAAILVTGAGCYALKLLGLTAPRRLLAHPAIQRFASLVPVALLTALVAVQTVADGRALEIDGPRLAGLVVAVIALLLRAPFLVVLASAAAVAAGLRLLAG